jgi:hypothetical protein
MPRRGLPRRDVLSDLALPVSLRLAAGFLAAFIIVLAPDGERTQAQAGGAPSVEVGSDQLVLAARPGRPLIEPHLASNPRNGQHLVGAAIVSVRQRDDLMQGRCVAVASFDGGRSWVAHEFPFPRCYDPWVAILDDGTAIFVALETTEAGAVPHLWLYRSRDGGRTWTEPPRSFGRAHDHPTLMVDRSGRQFHNALYVTSIRVSRDSQGRTRTKAFVARSMDGGRTFPYTNEHEATNMSSNVMTAGVLPDGTLLLPQSAHQRFVADDRAAVPLQRPLHWALRSDDGGLRLGPPLLITDRCAGPVGFPSLAVDLSPGAHRGRAYFVCHDGPRSGPYVMRSDDGGDRWSDPVHVPGAVAAGDQGRRQTSSIAVNREGIVAVSWHDRGPDTSSNCWNVTVALSGDGGQSFTDPQRVSTTASCPSTGDNGYTAERFHGGGDYSGLAALPDGTFQLLWADSRRGLFELYTANVRVTP